MIRIEFRGWNGSPPDRFRVEEYLHDIGIIDFTRELDDGLVEVTFMCGANFFSGKEVAVHPGGVWPIISMTADAHGKEREVFKKICAVLKSRFGHRLELGCRHLGCGV